MPRARELTDDEKQDIKDRYAFGGGIREISRITGFCRVTVRRLVLPSYEKKVNAKQNLYKRNKYKNDATFRKRCNKDSIRWEQENREKVNANHRARRAKLKALGLPAN